MTDAPAETTTGPLRIAVVGASGNLGSALLRRLRTELAGRPGSEIIGVSRRAPAPETLAVQPGSPIVSWHTIDIADDPAIVDLTGVFTRCDAVVHLAWLIQPTHQQDVLHRTNVDGSAHVLDAAQRAGVGQVIAASSVGAYSPGRKDSAVDEDWPTGGIATSSYSRHKVMLEAALDQLAVDAPGMVVTRVRPALVFQGNAGAEISALFLGRLVPTAVLGRLHLPFIPLPHQLTFQAVHADDVASAIWTVLEARAPGAFNVAADPQLTPGDLARAIGAGRSAGLPLVVLQSLADLTWRLRLQPTDKGWIDLAAQVPIMSTSRLRALGWKPEHGPVDALRELVAGMRTHRVDPAYPPLNPRT